MDKLAERLELGPARILGNLKKMGNTGSCSIPHLLYDLQKEHHATEKLIFCTAFGAGFQWAHSSVRLRKNGQAKCTLSKKFYEYLFSRN
ncbi:MAG: 3-oxoacyl-[acyl-carrier-protein] synthase III C-terminal domain-containing protein [Bdellovibrionota bacterium]